MPLDLRGKDIEALRGVFRQFPGVREVLVFGSRATGESRQRSDLDLAVRAPELTPMQWSDLEQALDDSPLLQILDVVRSEEITDPAFRAAIERDGVRIYPA